MKKSLLLLMFICCASGLYSQTTDMGDTPEAKSCITIGFLQGGGSLVGADLEFLLGKRLGLQVGAGLVGFGGALNIHFKPSIRSSFISLEYMHQGFGKTYTQSMIGPSLVYRGKKWFTCKIGVGNLIETGPAYPSGQTPPTLMLTYSIGGYIPFY